jgi:hypothetical protein
MLLTDDALYILLYSPPSARFRVSLPFSRKPLAPSLI